MIASGCGCVKRMVLPTKPFFMVFFVFAIPQNDQSANHDGQSEQRFCGDAEVVVQRMQTAAPVPVGQSEEWHDGLGSAKSGCT